MTVPETLSMLQMAIGPVIVISGVGLLLLSMTNRYGRVIDRSRQVCDGLRTEGEGTGEHRFSDQLRVLLQRARLLRLSIILASGSLLLTAFLIIILFLTAMGGLQEARVIVGLFAVAMVCLIASLMVFIWDINLSLGALQLEVDSARQETGKPATRN